MKTGESVYFYQNGRRYNYVFVHAPDDWDGAVIKNGVGEMRCRKGEIRLRSEVDKEEADAKLLADKAATEQVVELWGRGVKTGKDMATHSGLAATEMTRLIRLAKRRGFISDDSTGETP